jgi:hypothetical protein
MNDLIEKSLIMQGKSLALLNQQRDDQDPLSAYEFQVFSQFGEDGILQHLIQETGIDDNEKTFVEFGVQDYQESNTRFLLQGHHWQGLIIDGSDAWMESVKTSSLYWRYNLKAIAAWIDRENINDLILSSGLQGTIGFLSIDIDGNDYWVWERISCIKPIIIACEWNSTFGKEHALSIPYDPGFNRAAAHYSHQYWGASIAALHHLAERKGYALIGTNQAGNNLFFVDKDRLGRLKARRPEDVWVEAQFSDTRDKNGNLTFLRGSKRRQLIQDLPLVNVMNGETTSLKALKNHP